ncbi:hypothetical protein BC332_28525 [Capsicum chinense]|nr:hypothetical protein BC332_28525 [Capsicum chinense]
MGTPGEDFAASDLKSCNVEFPTRFQIERGRKRSKGSLREYKLDEYLNTGGRIFHSQLINKNKITTIGNQVRRHPNKSGSVCHGPLDRDISPSVKKIPYICNEIQQQTMSMIYLGIPEENVLAKYIKGIQCYCGLDAKVNSLATLYDSSENDPFILGIQTEWHLQQMIHLRNHSLIAADLTFGIKKL